MFESNSPSIILFVIVTPFVIWLVVGKIRETSADRKTRFDKLDQLFEEQLKHDTFDRVILQEIQLSIKEINTTTEATSSKLMHLLDRLLNGSKKHGN